MLALLLLLVLLLLLQVSRMEAGDHWLVYGEVNDGALQNEKELTAVMHRKVGNHY
jgi:flavin reductase (DIM6/NTAB) family NADH-FMN oxidoreductase RutF